MLWLNPRLTSFFLSLHSIWQSSEQVPGWSFLSFDSYILLLKIKKLSCPFSIPELVWTLKRLQHVVCPVNLKLFFLNLRYNHCSFRHSPWCSAHRWSSPKQPSGLARTRVEPASIKLHSLSATLLQQVSAHFMEVSEHLQQVQGQIKLVVCFASRID